MGNPRDSTGMRQLPTEVPILPSQIRGRAKGDKPAAFTIALY